MSTPIDNTYEIAAQRFRGLVPDTSGDGGYDYSVHGIGDPADAAVTTATLPGSVIAILKGILSKTTGGTGGTGGGGGTPLAETLWTDDSGAYYIRVDNGTTITFVTPTGAAATTGSGLRPAGDAATVDRASYSATAAGTGYSIGDLIDNIVAIDRSTHAVVTNLWLNLSTGALIAAPGSANIKVLTASNVALETGGNLATIAAAQGAAGTGITQPAGGTGIIGFLSGIYNALKGTLTVTASAGTNLNTSALALENGGNLASVKTSATAIAAATGTTADASQIDYTQTASLMSVLKGISQRLAGSLGITGVVGIDQTTLGTTNGVVLKDGSGNVVDYSSAAPVIGNTAAGTALTDAPINIGGIVHTLNPTPLVDGQAVHTMHDKLGKVIAVSAVRVLKGKLVASLADAAAHTIVTAGAAGVFQDVFRLRITNPNTTSVTVTISDGTNSYPQIVQAGATWGFSTDAGSAEVQPTSGVAWTAQLAAAPASAVTVVAEWVSNV